jgi:hypothetical protein
VRNHKTSTPLGLLLDGISTLYLITMWANSFAVHCRQTVITGQCQERLCCSVVRVELQPCLCTASCMPHTYFMALAVLVSVVCAAMLFP